MRKISTKVRKAVTLTLTESDISKINECLECHPYVTLASLTKTALLAKIDEMAEKDKVFSAKQSTDSDVEMEENWID